MENVRGAMMYDFEVEKNIIGGLLNDNARYDDVSGVISADDFGNGLYKSIYEDIQNAVLSGQPVNIQTLAHNQKYKGKITDIISLTTNASSANVGFFADQLKDLTVARRLKSIAEDINHAVDNKEDLKPLVEKIEVILSEISSNKNKFNYESLNTCLQLAIKNIQKSYETKGMTGLTTGFPSLDELTGGLQPQEVLIIGARPGIGKTYFAMKMAQTISDKNPVAFFSLEMDKVAIATRYICMNASVNILKIRSGHLDEMDISAIHDATAKIYEKPIYLFDMPNADLLSIKTKARQLKRQKNIKALFIDYMGLISYNANMQRWEKVGIISAQLKGLARELDIPIIVLSQVTRDSQDKMPSLASLRDSGSVEQDADIVMFLHRENDDCDAELSVSKNRHGFCGLVKLHMDKKSGVYREKYNQETKN